MGARDSEPSDPGRTARDLRPLLVFFFFSGAAGLIYQVIWVREFGNIFGNTIHSASLVVAVFMGGLGLGAALAGRWADRRYAGDAVAPLKLYARVEILIAVSALAVALGLPALVELSAPISRYVPGPNGWFVPSTGSHAARYAVAVAILLPATTLMGATLTLLIRYAVAADVASAGWRIGLLYAANTLGAAAGTFLTDMLLVPSMGLRGTQMVAVLANLGASLGAFRLSAGRSGGAAGLEAPPAVAAEGSGAGVSGVLLGAAIFLAGFAAMGMEIVWFRHMSSMQVGQRSVFSTVLGVILLGIVAGSFAGGRIERRTRRPVEIFVVCQACFVAATLAGLFLYHRVAVSDVLRSAREQFGTLPEAAVLALRFGVRLVPTLFVVGLPALFLGATFPLVNACIQRAEHTVGRRAGALYFANTFGGVAGSLVAGFAILPALGSRPAVALLCAVAGAGVVVMQLAASGLSGTGSRVRAAACTGTAAAIGAGVLLWLQTDADFLVMRSIEPLLRREGVQVLAVSEGTTETAVVLTRGDYSDLVTDGHPMSSTHRLGQRYMRAFSHLPLLMMDSPERVLVICFGVGNTLHAASLHPSVRELDVADLSENVLGQARWFADANGNVLSDPRVRVFVNDGRQHLRMSPENRYDLVTLEPPPINLAGVSALYSKEFYELARSRLRPGGFVTQWLPPKQVSAEAVLAAVRAFIEVFPQAVLVSGTGLELILMGTSADGIKIDAARVARILAERPAVREDLKRYSMARLTEIVGSFVSDAATMERVTNGVPPLTDDLPIMEYAEFTPGVDRIPTELFNVEAVAAWCPGCFSDGEPVAPLTDLREHLSVSSILYAQPHLGRSIEGLEKLPLSARNTILRSPYFLSYFRTDARGGTDEPSSQGAE
ncbi:MAG: fused MFS/spermidine synthase [Deltaproteobacteria bacterium]|nr:fused MFS/spermidine synthase [Deltaproteobacteria bacterium]